MKKAIYCGGIIALLTTAVLVCGTRVDAQDTNRFPGQRLQGAFLPLIGPGSSIGITVRDSDTGVLVQEVRSETPASRAGLKEGDIVTEFDGERGLVDGFEESASKLGMYGHGCANDGEGFRVVQSGGGHDGVSAGSLPVAQKAGIHATGSDRALGVARVATVAGMRVRTCCARRHSPRKA